MQHALRHLGIAVDALVIHKPFLLHLASGNDSGANRFARFTGSHLRELCERHGLYLAMDVDTVEQRTTDLVHIPLYLSGRAGTTVSGVAIIAARTWIHGGYKHKRTGILHAVFCTADGDTAVLQRLAHHLQHRPVELRQFVAEQHTIVCQTDFTGLRILSATNQCHLRDGVVGRTERALTDEAGVAVELAGDRVYLGGL